MGGAPRSSGLRRLEVLAGADHRDADGVLRTESPDRGADRRRTLERGEEPEEHHTQGPVGGGRGRRLLRGVVPLRRGPDGDDDRLRPQALGHQVAVLVGVEDHHVGDPQRRAVDRAEQPLLEAGAADPTVLGGRRGEHQVVEHDRRAREEQACEPDVEVPHVADEHGVRPAGGPRAHRLPGEP
ncbi:hypothetical protein [Curtobacterium sp. MCPF17_052]|uniref:hypothetical protein n=1 Tax=Curtobacterium sp. MCPF17_052 TaxID=2175655 RepID=UPI0024DF8D7D|nr:hypothetical protein [Curtobacterium sp. MCPF17_052]WIB13026.1 hypothetical protein DEJ36_03265 [Curtobacterium sp. MCPF17_052]